ncbi:MAG: dTMP kinase [Calditrichia bacterium]
MEDSRSDLNRRFISFEGIDYSGKSTQISLLRRNLQTAGIDTVLVREPGGTEISEAIRRILLDPANRLLHQKTEILLYEAARAQLVHEKLLPLLQSGAYVIADRFFDSTTAYQGYGRNLDLTAVKQMNRFATSGLSPCKTFFIDITPQEAARRQQAGRLDMDRLESGGTAFFNKIREGFLKLCREEPERFIRVNGERPLEEITREIWQTVEQLWKPGG